MLRDTSVGKTETSTGEILDLVPLHYPPVKAKGEPHKRKTADKDDSALFIGLLGLLVASIALAK